MRGMPSSTAVHLSQAREKKNVPFSLTHIVLLSAPADVIVERLASRTNNSYGKQPGEVARVVGLIDTVEPLLRRAADHEIDTSVPVEEVVATVLRLVESSK